MTKGIDGADAWNHMQRIRLRQMGRPACKAKAEPKQMSLTKGAQFSNIICQECRAITNSKGWICNCGVLWYKCALHEKGCRDESYEKGKSRKKRKVEKFVNGIDVPFPKFRRRTEPQLAVSSNRDANGLNGNVLGVAVPGEVRLKPGTTMHRLFAKRFPRFVEAVDPT